MGCLASAVKETREEDGLPGADRYTDPEGFREMLESGAVRLLKGSYLIDLYEEGGRIERRQDLPDAAFWSAEEAMRNLNDRRTVSAPCNNTTLRGVGGNYFLVALSYRWTEPEHPDRARHHLGALARFLRLHREWVCSCTDLQDTAVFWDFPCLFQLERTPEQSKLFKKGLGSANVLYGHLYSFVVMQSSQPEGSQDLEYFASGWCQFESAVASLNKWSIWYQDISACANGGPKECSVFPDLIKACQERTKRPVPLTEERMRHQLSRASFTNGMSDENEVVRMYSDISDAIFSKAREVSLSDQPWTSEDAARMAEVLPCYSAAAYLRMWGTSLERDCAETLGQAIRLMPSLEKVAVDCSIFGPDTPAVLADFLPPSLKTLQLSNGGGRGAPAPYDDAQKQELAEALARWCRDESSPQSLDLKHMLKDANFMDIVSRGWQEAGRPARDIKWC